MRIGFAITCMYALLDMKTGVCSLIELSLESPGSHLNRSINRQPNITMLVQGALAALVLAGLIGHYVTLIMDCDNVARNIGGRLNFGAQSGDMNLEGF